MSERFWIRGLHQFWFSVNAYSFPEVHLRLVGLADRASLGLLMQAQGCLVMLGSETGPRKWLFRLDSWSIPKDGARIVHARLFTRPYPKYLAINGDIVEVPLYREFP